MKNLYLFLSTIILALTGQDAFSQSPCSHTFNGQDSWGDGWNGASVTIRVNGSAVVSGWAVSGASGST